MGLRRFVLLDPDGTGGDWLHVVVRAKTGVFYQQQYGGTCCRQGQVEGYLVPLTGPDALRALRELFEKDLRGAGRVEPRVAGRSADQAQGNRRRHPVLGM